METSRDDFIIAIRSAFLKKGNKQRFSLLVLILFSIILITLGRYNFTPINNLRSVINEIVYRTSFIVSIPEKYIEQSYLRIQDHLTLYKDYDLTKKKLEKLQSKKYNIEFLIAENERLKKTLEATNYTAEQQVAKVLIDKESPFLRSIIINKGSKNEIKKGMAVLYNNYLVGKVVEVNYATSRILLLSDINSKIPITIEPGGIQSILSGNGSGMGIIQYSKKKLPIEPGAIVYTSGTGGLFKEGIPIGKITKSIINEKSNVEFFSDFSQLRFVNIAILQKKINND
tara:strand:- start:610 stop:1464 length:855 start_codon:yes stop_codon:yes gene_type:complete